MSTTRPLPLRRVEQQSLGRRSPSPVRSISPWMQREIPAAFMPITWHILSPPPTMGTAALWRWPSSPTVSARMFWVKWRMPPTRFWWKTPLPREKTLLSFLSLPVHQKATRHVLYQLHRYPPFHVQCYNHQHEGAYHRHTESYGLAFGKRKCEGKNHSGNHTCCL